MLHPLSYDTATYSIAGRCDNYGHIGHHLVTKLVSRGSPSLSVLTDGEDIV